MFNQIILNHGDNDYNIEHLSKEKLEQMGQLPDVLDVVEEGMTLYHFNTPTNNTNDEMDEVGHGNKCNCQRGGGKCQHKQLNDQLGDEGMQTQTHT